MAAANLLLREGIEGLAAGIDVDALLGRILLTITEIAEGRSGELWMSAGDQADARLHLAVRDGRIASPAVDHPVADNVPAGGLRSFAGDGVRYGQASRRAEIMSLLAQAPDSMRLDEPGWDDGAGDGAAAELAVPIRLGQQSLGLIVVRLAGQNGLVKEDRELIQTLANQAALALDRSRLVEDARGAAAAHERADQATRRAKTLARANAGMHQSVAALASGLDLQAFLAEILAAAVENLHAAEGGVWRYDPEQEVTRLTLSYENGRVRRVPLDPAAGGRVHVDRKADRQRLAALARASAMVRYSLTPRNPDEALAPDYAVYLQARELTSVLIVPLFIGDAYQGVLSFRFVEDRVFTPDEEEFAYALANQAVLALEVCRLAEAAREAAVAREREEQATRRAEALARIGHAGRSTLRRLSEKPDIDGFLGHVLTVCAEQFGAVAGGVWITESENSRLVLRLEDGQIHKTASTPQPGRSAVIHADGEGHLLNIGLERRGMIQVYDLDAIRNVPGSQPYSRGLLEHGIRQIIGIPMFFGDEYRGSLTLRFTDKRALAPEEEGLAHALANQAVLALEMSQLAEEARDAAVARARYGELSRANAALRQPLEALSNDAGAEVVISQILGAARDIVEAASVSIWLYDVPNDSAEVLCTLDDDGFRKGAERNNPYYGHLIPLTAAVPDLAGFIGARRHRWIEVAPASGLLSPAQSFLQGRGVRWLAVVPMLLGGNLIGAVNLRLAGDIDPDRLEESMELVQTLAHQAALAIHLDRLAERARQTTLRGERARIAREVHDTLAQGFATIAMRAALAGSDDAGETLASIGELAREHLVEARRTFAALKVEGRDSLHTLLDQLVDAHRRGGENRIRFEGEPVPVTGEVAHELTRIAQEAIHNALRHANPTTVMLELSQLADGSVSLTVSDDGRGFDLAAGRLGYGLTAMRERAESIGAAYHLSTTPGAGAQVQITYPSARTAIA